MPLCRGQLSLLTSGIVTSASLFGALLGSFAAFLLKDRVGRKAELLFAAAAYGEAEEPILSMGSLQAFIVGAVSAYIHLHQGLQCHLCIELHVMLQGVSVQMQLQTTRVCCTDTCASADCNAYNEVSGLGWKKPSEHGSMPAQEWGRPYPRQRRMCRCSSSESWCMDWESHSHYTAPLPTSQRWATPKSEGC